MTENFDDRPPSHSVLQKIRQFKSTANANEQVHSIDLLRVFLAFWIIIFHLAHRVRNIDSFYSNYVGRGTFGVECFFLLSGFVLTFTYLPRQRAISDPEFVSDYKRFVFKRIIKIWPLHVILTIFDWPFDPDCSLLNVANQVTFTQFLNPKDILNCNIPSWFLHQEVYFYLLFPLILSFAAHCKNGPFLLFLTFWGLLIAYFKFALPLWNKVFPIAMLRAAPSFIIGTLIGLIYAKKREKSAVFDAILLILIYVTQQLLGTTFPSENYFYMLGFFVFGFLLYCASRSVVFNYLCNNRITKFLSSISFAMYIFHWPALTFIEPLYKLAFSTLKNHTYVVFCLLTWLFVMVLAIPLHFLVDEKLREKLTKMSEY